MSRWQEWWEFQHNVKKGRNKKILLMPNFCVMHTWGNIIHRILSLFKYFFHNLNIAYITIFSLGLKRKMLGVIKPHWQVISMTQFLKLSNDMKEFFNWGHSLLFVSNKCDSQIWGTPLCFFPNKKSPSQTCSTLKKNTLLSNISTFHFFGCLWRPDPKMFKRRCKFDYMYLMALILFSQKDWLDS